MPTTTTTCGPPFPGGQKTTFKVDGGLMKGGKYYPQNCCPCTGLGTGVVVEDSICDPCCTTPQPTTTTCCAPFTKYTDGEDECLPVCCEGWINEIYADPTSPDYDPDVWANDPTGTAHHVIRAWEFPRTVEISVLPCMVCPWWQDPDGVNNCYANYQEVLHNCRWRYEICNSLYGPAIFWETTPWGFEDPNTFPRWELSEITPSGVPGFGNVLFYSPSDSHCPTGLQWFWTDHGANAGPYMSASHEHDGGILVSYAAGDPAGKTCCADDRNGCGSVYGQPPDYAGNYFSACNLGTDCGDPNGANASWFNPQCPCTDGGTTTSTSTTPEPCCCVNRGQWSIAGHPYFGPGDPVFDACVATMIWTNDPNHVYNNDEVYSYNDECYKIVDETAANNNDHDYPPNTMIGKGWEKCECSEPDVVTYDNHCWVVTSAINVNDGSNLTPDNLWGWAPCGHCNHPDPPNALAACDCCPDPPLDCSPPKDHYEGTVCRVSSNTPQVYNITIGSLQIAAKGNFTDAEVMNAAAVTVTIPNSGWSFVMENLRRVSCISLPNQNTCPFRIVDPLPASCTTTTTCAPTTCYCVYCNPVGSCVVYYQSDRLQTDPRNIPGGTYDNYYWDGMDALADYLGITGTVGTPSTMTLKYEGVCNDPQSRPYYSIKVFTTGTGAAPCQNPNNNDIPPSLSTYWIHLESQVQNSNCGSPEIVSCDCPICCDPLAPWAANPGEPYNDDEVYFYNDKCYKVVDQTSANQQDPADPPDLLTGEGGWEECECCPTTTTAPPPTTTTCVPNCLPPDGSKYWVKTCKDVTVDGTVIPAGSEYFLCGAEGVTGNLGVGIACACISDLNGQLCKSMCVELISKEIECADGQTYSFGPGDDLNLANHHGGGEDPCLPDMPCFGTLKEVLQDADCTGCGEGGGWEGCEDYDQQTNAGDCLSACPTTPPPGCCGDQPACTSLSSTWCPFKIIRCPSGGGSGEPNMGGQPEAACDFTNLLPDLESYLACACHNAGPGLAGCNVSLCNPCTSAECSACNASGCAGIPLATIQDPWYMFAENCDGTECASGQATCCVAVVGRWAHDDDIPPITMRLKALDLGQVSLGDCNNCT